MNSRQNTQVIAPSRLSHTAVVNYQHTGARLTCATLFLFLPHLTSYVVYIKKLNSLEYVFFVAKNIFLRRRLFLRLKEFDPERTFIHKFTDFRDILSWLRLLSYVVPHNLRLTLPGDTRDKILFEAE